MLTIPSAPPPVPVAEQAPIAPAAMIRQAPKEDENVVGVEARHVVFCPPPRGYRDDMHMVKEIVHFKDGTTKPRITMIPNFKRTYYITKPGFRDHEEQKEWESKDRLNRYVSTQSQLTWNIAKSLDMPYFQGSYRQLARSPYIYGADIKSTTLIKRHYQDKFGENTTPSSVAVLDIETDVVRGDKDILMVTISFKDKIVTAVDRKFVAGIVNPEAKLQDMLQFYMKEDIEKRNIKWEVLIVDGPVECIKQVIQRAHVWMPDFIMVWNINFDLPYIVETLEKANVDPADVFSAPEVPKSYRHFKYKEGKTHMITASDKRKPLKWMEQWHTVFTPASFYFIDGACAYKRIRTGAEADEPSYSLEWIMQKHLKRGKMKFEQGGHLSKLSWHIFMQKHHKLEYIIYNVFDCVGPELLDEETKDLQLTLPMMAGASDFFDFSSQPRCSADNIHFFLHQRNHVIGTTGDNLAHELDKLTVTREGWISTLPAHNVADNGLRLLADNPYRRTNIRVHVGDLDVAASYPNGGAVFNASKSTTVREIHKIDGVEFEDMREQGLNLSGGRTNAVEFCCVIYKNPSMDTFLDSFMQDMAVVSNAA